MNRVYANKIFNPIHLFVVSILLSPLAGMVMIGYDYRAFGRKNWIAIALLPLLIIIIATGFNLVMFEKNFETVQLVLTFLLSCTYYLYAKKLEDEERISNYRSAYTVFAIGLVTMLITLPLVYGTL